MKLNILKFLKKEPVLIIALLLGLISACVIRPGLNVIYSSIDYRTISLLFCLMILVKAFQDLNLLDWMANSLLKICKNDRTLYFVLVFFVFFISMFVTNDVALLTFVPITLLVCSRANLNACNLIIFETLAANLGSCVTPMGNPQNLFLFSYYKFGVGDFFANTLKIGIISAFLLIGVIYTVTRKNIKQIENDNNSVNVRLNWKFVLYLLDFILTLFTVFHLVDYKITLIITIAVIAVCNFKLFVKIDYSLLFTFAGFFIFTGTISTVESFSNFLKSVLDNPLKTYIAGILTSQIISNVPASLLLSGFTSNGKELLLSVNVGGLGTLIASMASVISFKLYNNSENSNGKTYFLKFTGYNFSLLIILALIIWFIR
ncbi:MAG: SLC13 family permease [Treponema sp.]|nr:SLC13 family permease [Treponema sp.]